MRRFICKLSQQGEPEIPWIYDIYENQHSTDYQLKMK